MIRFGIIGTNFITDSLLEASLNCPEFELTAVYSRSLDRAREFADKYGAKLVFDDLEAFAACDQIDAVYVASPNCCHAPQSILMMEHGKHLIPMLILRTIKSAWVCRNGLHQVANKAFGIMFVPRVFPLLILTHS